MRVFIGLGDSGIEGSFRFESIALPQFGDLTDDFLAVGISFPSFDGRVETIHDTVDLQAGGVVYFTEYATKSFTTTSLEDSAIESMTDAMRCC